MLLRDGTLRLPGGKEANVGAAFIGSGLLFGDQAPTFVWCGNDRFSLAGILRHRRGTNQCCAVARFHICCAHELCEMDVSNFDPKINNENLEKTMKTVLDMYEDARRRKAGRNCCIPLLLLRLLEYLQLGQRDTLGETEKY